MSTEQALAFLLFSVVAAITPGPSNTMLTVTGATAGVVPGLRCLLGVASGMGVMMFSTAFGLGALVLAQPRLTNVLMWCGAGFLLWLSWKIATATDAGGSMQAQPVGFVGAFAFQWLNPKSWIVSTSASGAYTQPGREALAQALAIGSLFFAIALLCGLVWLTFGVALREVLKSPTYQRPFNVVMGALLACSVLFLVW